MIQIMFLYIFTDKIVLFGEIANLFSKSAGQVRAGEALGNRSGGTSVLFGLLSEHPINIIFLFITVHLLRKSPSAISRGNATAYIYRCGCTLGVLIRITHLDS